MDLIYFLKIIWFFLPAAIANMSPVLFKWINFLNYPIDLNKTFLKKPIFGKNKTFRGFFFGIIMAILFAYIQVLLYPISKPISLINYNQINFILLGFLLGFGALFGDLIKSFIKRQLNIEPGKSLVPLDQIDWIIGSIVFIFAYIQLSSIQIITAVIMLGLLHPVINILGYLLKIKKNKF